MQQNVLMLVGFGHTSQFDFRAGFGRQNNVTHLNACNVIKYFSGFIAEVFAFTELTQSFPQDIS